MKRIICWFIFLVCFSAYAKAQDFKVDANLGSSSIQLGDQTQLRLSIRFSAKDKVSFPELKDSIGKIELVGAAKADTSFDKNDNSIKTIAKSYTITSFDPGTYQIPAYEFKTPNGVVSTSVLQLQVLSVQVDTSKAVYDIKRPMVVTYTFLDWLKDNWYWIALALFLVVAVIGLIYYLKTRPKDKTQVTEVKVVIPAHTLALNKLTALRDKKLWQQNMVKEYHSELSDIMREYLEKRYAVKALEQTTDEIFAGLKYVKIASQNRNVLRRILVLADLVKFAKEKPLEADNEQSMDNALNFVAQTKLDNLPSQNKESNRNGLV